MTTPVLVLHAPERSGSRHWKLGADLLIGDDAIMVNALIGPDTQAWMRSRGKQTLGWAEDRIKRASKFLRKHVKVTGDWGRFGDLGSLAFATAQEVAQHPELSIDESMIRAVELYQGMNGEHGTAAQQNAYEAWKAIEAQKGSNQHAQQASAFVGAVVTADEISRGMRDPRELSHPLVGEASKALGYCCSPCKEKMLLGYDSEESVLCPELPDRLGGIAGHALRFRPLAAAGKKPLAQAYRELKFLATPTGQYTSGGPQKLFMPDVSETHKRINPWERARDAMGGGDGFNPDYEIRTVEREYRSRREGMND